MHKFTYVCRAKRDMQKAFKWRLRKYFISILKSFQKCLSIYDINFSRNFSFYNNPARIENVAFITRAGFSKTLIL